MRHNSKKLYISSLLNKEGKHEYKVQPFVIQLRLTIHASLVFINAISRKIPQADYEIIHQENKTAYS